MRPTLPLIGGLLLTTLLVGCSSNPAPLTLPPVTSSPTPSRTPALTPTPSPSISNVEKPVLADEVSPEGLSAFATYYYAVLTKAGDTGDSRLLESLSDPTCLTCTAYINAVNYRKSQGDERMGGGFAVVNAIAPGIAPGDTMPALTVNIKTLAGTRTHPDGSTEPIESSAGEVTMQLRRTGATWVALRIVTM